MKKMRLKQLSLAAIISIGATGFFASCNDNGTPEELPGEVIEKDFQLSFASGSGSISGTYLQGVPDVTQGEISFFGRGYSLTSSRTARIWFSEDGSTAYSLNYTQGVIDKLTYHGGTDYREVASLDASVTLGHSAVRFTKINDEIGSVHYAASPAAEIEFGPNNEYLGHKITASIGILNLSTFNFGSNYNANIDVVLPGTLKQEGYNITRIDAPVISGNKIYYGAAVSKYDPSTATNTATDMTFTLVLDYPSLTNATVITTDIASGATNGYRTPTQYVNESGEILQQVNAGGKTSILKIVDGQYTSFKFSLDEKLGKQTNGSSGWFYAGNGIGYIPYENLSAPESERVQIGVNPQGVPSYSFPWGVARVDLNNNTVVDLDVPAGLWLFQYQNAVVRDGVFYMVLNKIGENGHVYMFDVDSTSPQGRTGATVTSGADQYFIGIY